MPSRSQALQPHDRVKILPCGHTFHSAPCPHGCPRRAAALCAESRGRRHRPLAKPLVRSLSLLSIQMFFSRADDSRRRRSIRASCLKRA